MAFKKAPPFGNFDFGFEVLSVNLIKAIDMSTAELKQKLIAQINDTDNDELLSEISTMLYVESKSANGVYQMSAAEREAVEDGLSQIKKGQWISDEEANRQVEEWLRK